MSRDQVLAQRLRTQRLAAPALAAAADAVELLTCVQAQERDHAFFSLSLRTRDSTYATVRAGLDRGDFLRTHILRPTWHFVRPADLRWILALTSARLESSMAARHRELGLDDARVVDRALTALRELLAERNYLTRAEIGRVFTARGRGLPEPGSRLGHLLLIAELRGVICSGPLRGVHHSYALVDEVVPRADELDPDEALHRLLHRFFAGHGPASAADFARWSSLPAGVARRALSDLADRLETITLDGVEHWFDPTAVPRATRTALSAWLLPVYDEAVLTYPRTGFPAPAEHPFAGRPDPFWAPVICGLRNVGLWKRSVRRDQVTVDTRLAPTLGSDARDAVEAAAVRLAAFLELPLELGRLKAR